MAAENIKDGPKSSKRDLFFLFYISFLSLFLELLLIRWVSTEIRIFAYFRNLVLISCFLGLGIGFSLKKFKTGILFALILTALLAIAVYPNTEFHGVSLRKIPEYLVFPEFHMWAVFGNGSVIKWAGGFAMVAGVMALLAGIFIPFGQILGQIFEASDNRLRDYSVNLIGSLLGTWTFALLSYLGTPPWVWFVIGVGGASGYLAWSRSWKVIPGLAALSVILLITVPKPKNGDEVFWSPYQKLTYQLALFDYGSGREVPYQAIEVNTVVYMYMFDLSYKMADWYPWAFNRADFPYYPYDIIYRFHPSPDRVLIVGAGAGNDAAAAIRNGALRIDAVEIDPVIARLGRRRHPERPYQNPRVRLIIDDARSFFKKSKDKYDLIIFGLLDSHTLTSNFTNINLDSYVYTLESIREAKDHLAQGGVLIVSFYTERKWLGYKLYEIMNKVFGKPPLVYENHELHAARGTIGTVFINGDLGLVNEQIRTNPKLKEMVDKQGVTDLRYQQLMKESKFDAPEDDWPYLYLMKRQIPTLHLIMSAIVIAFMLAAVLFLFPGRKIGPGHFLFLGAGFMLVEVHSISKIALLFGSTWIVNIVIISAILVMVLCANLLAIRHPIERVRLWYAGLFASLLLAYLIPVNSLIFGSYLARGIIAGAFYSLPLFFAGVIFASSIKKVADIDAAFASNMMGAALGGMLESTSYLVGLKAVLLIAMLLYAASWLALRKVPLAPSRDAQGQSL